MFFSKSCEREGWKSSNDQAWSIEKIALKLDGEMKFFISPDLIYPEIYWPVYLGVKKITLGPGGVA